MRFVDASRGVPTKNLFLKAKKANGAEDSGLWLVVAAFDTTVDMKKLTSVAARGGLNHRTSSTRAGRCASPTTSC